MRKENGITLTALTITIIVLLLLAGVALSIVMGENNIFKTTENAVEQNNKVQVKEKIELAIMEKQLEEKREVSLDEIIDKLIEKEITTEEESDREIGTVITEEGYVATIKEKEEGGWEVIIGEKGTARIRLNISKTPEILTSKITIKIEGSLIGIGLKELQMPDGSKKEYEEGITKIEETYEVTANGTYKFVLIGRDGQKAEEEIEINNILEGVIAINPSEIEWTNEEITIEVIYPIGSEELIKEIKIGEEEWKEYKGEEKISENTTIKARIRNTEETIITASLIITNIDKLAPNTFVPEVSVTSNSITIRGKTTDKEATSTNGSSGIAGYYYSKDEGSSWQTNTNPLTESYTYTGLSQGTSYPLKMKAVDKAGNETVIDIGNKTTTDIAGLGTITIKPSTTTPTNQDIKVSVTWPSNTEGLTKQISINNGSTWSTYTGEVTISSNCTVKARLIDSINQTGTAASLTITNIDKLAPNTFVPEVSVTSNSITISGRTTDKEATSTNGSSGIAGYYYSKDGGSSWQTNTNPLTESYTYTGLSQGTSYPLKMKAIDKAGNETVIDIGNKTTTNIAGLGTITIKPSTTTPTNQDIKVSVTWPSNTEGLTKQISINNGSTWSTYTGEVTISSNCTVKARLIDSINQTGTAASLTITNIDKLAPNTFVPEISVTSNSITISGKTTDKEATSTNGSSGIAGYYYSKDGGSSWQANTNPLTESYTYTGLSQGTSYPLKMKAVDKAGNETVIDIGNKTTTNIAGLGTITIKPSTTIPTNQDIKVSVTWPSNTEGLTKQISVNNGSTWSTYTGEVTISSNCTVKARLIDSINQTGTTASLTITNIDKLAPNTFVPEVSVTSNSITISGKTTDKEATSTNGSSGIAGYYYSKDGGSSWQTNTNPLTESYTYTGLSQGTSYPLKMKAVDKAGNETVIDIGNKTTTNIAGLGTITIKPSTTTPTNQDIKVSVTWPSNTEGLTKQISINNGSTWSTYTGEVTISSNCTVKARLIDSINQTGTVASLTITNIDKTNPTVTATAGTETITVGDSNEISKYFTWQANGIYGITSVVYTDTSNNNTVVTNTNTLAVGTHVIKCTVTKETGATASTTKIIIVKEPIIVDSTEIANNPSEHYGGYVTNYTTPSGDPNVGWRIFYADESNIYLIASDYIHYDYAPTSANYTLYKNSTDYKLSFNNVYQDYTGSVSITDTRIKKWLQKYLAVAPSSTNTSIRAVAFMLDETRWSAKYANSSYAEYAIGGPTLEMFVASYNETHPEKPMYCSVDQYGYYISWTEGGTDRTISGLDTSESLYVIFGISKAWGMWLASPSADDIYDLGYVMYVYCGGSVNYNTYYFNFPGFRPIVCLDSDIQLEKQIDGTYLIK